MILNDKEIRQLAQEEGMIDPFVPESVREVAHINGEHDYDGPTHSRKVISFGLSSFGYDIRVADDFMVFDPIGAQGGIVDPKNMEEDMMRRVSGYEYCIIPPNSFALARSVEYFEMPPDVLGVVYGKSTYARCGIITNVTPLEPGWNGQITLEISNTTPLPAKIYAREGLCQVLFMKGNMPDVTYDMRNGKYQDQVGITLPR